jgi:hypothetical protein
MGKMELAGIQGVTFFVTKVGFFVDETRICGYQIREMCEFFKGKTTFSGSQIISLIPNFLAFFSIHFIRINR